MEWGSPHLFSSSFVVGVWVILALVSFLPLFISLAFVCVWGGCF